MDRRSTQSRTNRRDQATTSDEGGTKPVSKEFISHISRTNHAGRKYSSFFDAMFLLSFDFILQFFFKLRSSFSMISNIICYRLMGLIRTRSLKALERYSRGATPRRSAGAWNESSSSLESSLQQVLSDISMSWKQKKNKVSVYLRQKASKPNTVVFGLDAFNVFCW